MASPQIDERFLQPLESMGLALEMKEVPLLILSEKDQWRFVQQITSILGGRGVYSGTADVTEQLLKSIKAPDYFFLRRLITSPSSGKRPWPRLEKMRSLPRLTSKTPPPLGISSISPTVGIARLISAARPAARLS